MHNRMRDNTVRMVYRGNPTLPPRVMFGYDFEGMRLHVQDQGEFRHDVVEILLRNMLDVAGLQPVNDYFLDREISNELEWIFQFRTREALTMAKMVL